MMNLLVEDIDSQIKVDTDICVPYSCSVCEQKTNSVLDLKLHLVEVHVKQENVSQTVTEENHWDISPNNVQRGDNLKLELKKEPVENHDNANDCFSLQGPSVNSHIVENWSLKNRKNADETKLYEEDEKVVEKEKYEESVEYTLTKNDVKREDNSELKFKKEPVGNLDNTEDCFSLQGPSVDSHIIENWSLHSRKNADETKMHEEDEKVFEKKKIEELVEETPKTKDEDKLLKSKFNSEESLNRLICKSEKNRTKEKSLVHDKPNDSQTTSAMSLQFVCNTEKSETTKTSAKRMMDYQINCKFCSYNAFSQAIVDQHVLQRHKHKETEKYPCKWLHCPRSFSSPSHLRKHLKSKTHTGEKIFKCLECSQSFKKSSNL
jgi:hypothetical protein